jgi:hypothetical protein
MITVDNHHTLLYLILEPFFCCDIELVDDFILDINTVLMLFLVCLFVLQYCVLQCIFIQENRERKKGRR